MSAGPETGLSPAADQSEIRNILSSAEELMHLSRAEEALEMLQSLLAKDAQHLQTLNTLGLCHYRLKNYDEAVKTFERLVEADPEQIAFRLNMSLVLIKLNKLEEAHEALNHVLSVEPNHQRAHSVLGLVYEQKGDFEKAMAHYEQGGENTRLSHLQRVSLTPQSGELKREAGNAHTEYGTNPDALVTAEEMPPPAPEAQDAVLIEDHAAAIEEKETTPSVMPRSSMAINLNTLATRFQCPTQAKTPQHPAEDLLYFPIDEAACVRLATTSALIGALRTQKVLRQSKQNDSQIRLGGEAPLTRLIGKGAALLFTGDAQSNLLELNQECVHLMEDTVLAFSQGIDWENAVLSGPTFDLHSLKLEGTGHIAIATSKALLAIPVKTKIPVQVHSSQVVGWVGEIKPVLSPFSIEPEEDNAAMLFEGEGAVWVLAENPTDAPIES